MNGRTAHDETAAQRERARHQSIAGLLLAAAIIALWLIVHVAAVFFYQWGRHSLLTAPLIIALTCWLYVGLFIVAHDCMHGSLVPFHPAWNRAIGRLCLTLYAGFSYDVLNRKHHLHHRHSGTPDDPDFDERPPHGVASWYWKFMVEYFTLRQAAVVVAVTIPYLFVFEVRYANLLAFWALPAILSSFQLFYFGTYLPHRPSQVQFIDRHRARSSGYGWWLSLLTCFHFGHHHEHHLRPDVPWWRLPGVRTENL